MTSDFTTDLSTPKFAMSQPVGQPSSLEQQDGPGLSVPGSSSVDSVMQWRFNRGANQSEHENVAGEQSPRTIIRCGYGNNGAWELPRSSCIKHEHSSRSDRNTDNSNVGVHPAPKRKKVEQHQSDGGRQVHFLSCDSRGGALGGNQSSSTRQRQPDKLHVGERSGRTPRPCTSQDDNGSVPSSNHKLPNQQKNGVSSDSDTSDTDSDIDVLSPPSPGEHYHQTLDQSAAQQPGAPSKPGGAARPSGMRVKCQVLIKDEGNRERVDAFPVPSTSRHGQQRQDYSDIEEVGRCTSESHQRPQSSRSLSLTNRSPGPGLGRMVSVTASIAGRGSVSATVSATVDSVLGRADVTASTSSESGASVADVTLSSSEDSDIEVVNVETKKYESVLSYQMGGFNFHRHI